MSLRIRADGTMWCAAHTSELPGDTYVDDNLHHDLNVAGLIVALPMPEHIYHPQWWWRGSAPVECDFSGARP